MANRTANAGGRQSVVFASGGLCGIGLTLLVLLTTSYLDRGDQAGSESQVRLESTPLTVTTEPPEMGDDQENLDLEPATVTDQLFVSPAGTDGINRGRTVLEPLRTPEAALDLALEGDTIFFAAGTYPRLVIQRKVGLTIVGDAAGGTVFTGEGFDRHAAVTVKDSIGVSISQVGVENALWGVVISGSSTVVFRDSVVQDVGQEGILVRDNSVDVEISGNTITRTGLREGNNGEFAYSTFGEGIYLGTGGRLEDGQFDVTTDIEIRNNRISFTSAEAIDVKSSVTSVHIVENVIHDIDTATSGAVVLGIGRRTYADHDILVERNVIYRVTRTSQWSDGNAIRVSVPATIRNNIIWDTQHRGIYIDKDLVSEVPSVVQVSGNLVLRTQSDPIENASTPSTPAVTVDISGNIVGDQARQLVPEIPEMPTREFIASLFELLLEETADGP